MRRVRLSPEASAYVRTEASYLNKRSAPAAEKFLRSVSGLKRNLLDFPGLGHMGAETPTRGVRRIVMDEYLVDYAVRGEVVNVLVIQHAKQMPPNQPISPEDDFEIT